MLFVRIDATPLPVLYAPRLALEYRPDDSMWPRLINWANGTPISVPSAPVGGDPVRELSLYPRGPHVKSAWVKPSIVHAFAVLARTAMRSQRVVDEAVRIREEADPDDPRRKAISITGLPDITAAGSEVFWHEAFLTACLYGPRMVAALVLALDDEQFPADARRDRAELLLKLRLMS